MRTFLTQDQIEDLLDYIGVINVGQWKGTKISFCCPIHGESHPSCGINSDFSPDDRPNEHLQVFHCFSCGASGTIPWFLHKSLPEQFPTVKSAISFLKSRYGVSYSYNSDTNFSVSRYEDFMKKEVQTDKRHVLPRSDLAPFKSGKETFKYFFDRGFDKNDVKEYMIGRDLNSRTVTIPAFWEDGQLAGIIGRYIDKNRPKNMRFKIYSFPKGSLIYPLDKLVVANDTIIGVESMFDAIMMRKWGILNVVSMMGDGMSKKQADQIASRCSKFLALFDADEGGRVAIKLAKEKLGDRVLVLEPTYYPKSGKDPIEWGELETLKVIRSCDLPGCSKIPRI